MSFGPNSEIADSAGERLARRYTEIFDWEEAEGVYDYRVDDVPLWRLIRNTTIIEATVAQNLENAHRPTRVSTREALALASGYLRSVAQLAAVPCADLLFWGVGRRQKTRDGFVSPLIDPIIDQLPQFESLLLERPLTGRHFQPATTRNLIWYDAPKVHARLQARISNTLPEPQQTIVDELAHSVAKYFSMPEDRIRRRLQIELSAFRHERAAASGVLAKAKAKAVLFTNRWVNSGVIAACRAFGTPAYEIQHGAVGDVGFKYHTPYSRTIDPDGFLVFANEWLTREWGMPPHRVHNIGAPFIWSERERTRGMICGSKVMLISQPNLSSELNTAFEEISQAFPEQQFLLQLHPQDRHLAASRYAVLRRPNVELAPSDQPLYESFKGCKAVIGQDSTALLEASFFGLKVGLLNLRGALQNSLRERIGAYNFFCADGIDQIANMFASSRKDECLNGNGYFDAFQADELADLLPATQ